MKIGEGITLEDTLVAHHSYASHLPQGLAHVGSMYCDIRPWKILNGKDAGGEKGTAATWEGENLDDEEAVEQYKRYNVADLRVTALSWKRMQADLEPERHTYEADKVIAQMCRRMRENGIGFDVGERTVLSKHLRARKAGLLGAMRDLVGAKRFDPDRHADVRRMLFGKFHAPVLRPTPGGLASTNNETLESLKLTLARRPGNAIGTLADLILRYRATDKTLGSYVDKPVFIEHSPEYGRVHPPWKLGPVTGRLSCWLMTLPRYGEDWETQVRKLYIPAPKRFRSKRAILVAQVHDAAIFEIDGVFVYYDLSQAEARCAAFWSGDEKLIAACKGDIHLANAMVVFSDSPETMKRLMRGNELSNFLDDKGKQKKWKAVSSKLGGCKDERDIAKNVGFCVWYEGSAERAFITLQAAGFSKATPAGCELIVDRFHGQYKRYYRYIDENEEFVRRNGYLRTVLKQRIRWLGWHAPRTEVSNFPIQSGIADLQNERLPEIEDRLPGCRTPDDVEKVIREVWERPIKVPHNGLEFVMPIDAKQGDRWSVFG